MDNDILVTAEFLEINDQLFDVLNNKGPGGLPFKAALSDDNIGIIEETFKQAEDLYTTLEDIKGTNIIHSKRRCGPLGLSVR